MPNASPASAGPVEPALIEDLVAANRVLASHGIVDGFGHVSIRHNRDANRYLMSRSRAPELVVAEDIMEYDLDSNPVEQRGRVMYHERYIHGEIYKVRPDVNAVVHHHSPSVIPFGVTTVPLRPVYHMSSFLAAGVPVYEIREAGGMTDMLVSTPALGEALARVVSDRPVALMRGHGAVVVAPSLKLAVYRSIYTEINARLQLQAMALGPVTYIAPEEARLFEATIAVAIGRPWELWKRQAERFRTEREL
jgi:ribulose-5-phosphate 4-epimerase/fuculose-1-phosphate aldolase